VRGFEVPSIFRRHLPSNATLTAIYGACMVAILTTVFVRSRVGDRGVRHSRALGYNASRLPHERSQGPCWRCICSKTSEEGRRESIRARISKGPSKCVSHAYSGARRPFPMEYLTRVFDETQFLDLERRSSAGLMKRVCRRKNFRLQEPHAAAHINMTQRAEPGAPTSTACQAARRNFAPDVSGSGDRGHHHGVHAGTWTRSVSATL